MRKEVFDRCYSLHPVIAVLPDDIDELRYCATNSLKEVVEHRPWKDINFERDVPILMERMKEGIRTNNLLPLIVFHEKEAAGSAMVSSTLDEMMCVSTEDVYVGGFYIEPKFRNTSCACTLLAAGYQFLKDRGFKRIIYSINVNEPDRHSYKVLGGEEESTVYAVKIKEG